MFLIKLGGQSNSALDHDPPRLHRSEKQGQRQAH